MAERSVSKVGEEYLASIRNWAKPNTIQNHTKVIRNFVEIVGNINIRNTEMRHADQFFAARKKTCQLSTLRLERDILSAWFKWCRDSKILPPDHNILAHIKFAKPQRKKKLLIPVTDFNRVLDCADDPRDRAIVAVGFFTFLRGSEIASLNIGDLNLSMQELHAVIHKKNQYEDDMPIPEELDAEMRRWMTHYAAHAPEGMTGLPDHLPLIPARSNGSYVGIVGKRGLQQVDRPSYTNRHLQTVHEQIKVVLGRAGYETFWQGGHTLRRSGARALYDQLCSEGHSYALRQVQIMLHHEDSATTEGYIGLTADIASRNARLKGKRMFVIPDTNVVHLPLRPTATGSEEG